MNESQIKQINDSLRTLSDYCKTRKNCAVDHSADGEQECPFYNFCQPVFNIEPESWFKEEYQ